MKEDRKPLRYITNGIVAMNFCWRAKEAEWRDRAETADRIWLRTDDTDMKQNGYLGQTQSVDEIHWDVGLRQIDYQPGGHVE